MRYVLWDFDGTLATRERMWSGALWDALLTVTPDLPCDFEDVRPFMQVGFPWHDWHIPHYHLDTPEKWWSSIFPLFSRAASAFGCDDIAAEKIAIVAKSNYLDITKWRLAPYAMDVLMSLNLSGWKNVIVSNHVPELPQLVEGLGIAPVIETIFSSANVGVDKPHPEFFEFVLRGLGEIEYACVVGDSVVADIGGARKANLPAILVGTSDVTADIAVATLREVPSALDVLAKGTSAR